MVLSGDVFCPQADFFAFIQVSILDRVVVLASFVKRHKYVPTAEQITS